MTTLGAVGLFTLALIGFIIGYTVNDIIRDDKRTIVRSLAYMFVSVLIVVTAWVVAVNIMIQFGY